MNERIFLRPINEKSHHGVNDDVNEAEDEHQRPGCQLSFDQRHFHVVEIRLSVEKSSTGHVAVANHCLEETGRRINEIERVETDDTTGEDRRDELHDQRVTGTAASSATTRYEKDEKNFIDSITRRRNLPDAA